MKKILVSLTLFVVLVIPGSLVFAQSAKTTPAPTPAPTPSKTTTPVLAPAPTWENYIPNEAKKVSGVDVASKRIINILLLVAGAVAVIYLIIGGYQYMTAGGNADTSSSARSTILNALIGLVIIFSAYAIVAFVLKKFIP